MEKKREHWIDSARGFLISCVVLFHAVGATASALGEYAPAALNTIYKFVEAFNMPSFFVLSGLLWPVCPRSFSEFFVRKVRRLIVPYFIFGGIAALMYLIFARKCGLRCDGWWQPFLSIIHAGNWPDGNGFRFNSPLWFLPCMFVVETVYYLIWRYSGRVWQQLAVFFVVASIWPYAPKLLPWGFTLAGKYLVFFMLGVFLSKLHVGLGFGKCAGNVVAAGGWFMGMIFLFLISVHTLVGWTLKTGLISICAIGLGASMRGKWIQWCGLSAMGIMLVHKPIISVMQPLLKCLIPYPASMKVVLTCLFALSIISASGFVVALIRRCCPFALGEFTQAKRRAV